jgi:hypothetical protein
VDEVWLSSEQAQKNKKSMQNLARDFCLRATELYLKITKEEFEFQHERLEKHLEDFPQDRDDEPPSTQAITDGDENEALVDEVFTQKPLQRQSRTVDHKALRLYEKYTEIALKRAILETEKEVHFLVERSVKETPFNIKEARNLNPVLRKDFMLQA